MRNSALLTQRKGPLHHAWRIVKLALAEPLMTQTSANPHLLQQALFIVHQRVKWYQIVLLLTAKLEQLEQGHQEPR
jgi:hypothetical protein